MKKWGTNEKYQSTPGNCYNIFDCVSIKDMFTKEEEETKEEGEEEIL